MSGSVPRALDGSSIGPLAEPLLARCTFPPAGTSVTCAVSGGADSSALAILAVGAGCVVTLVHVDHQLRPGSEAEADVVRALADRLGAAFVSLSVSLDDGPNLEARARDLRRAALPADALFGHTADDQAETIVLALIRGAGLDGLRGIVPEHHPILQLRRAETVALCAALEVDVVHDPSNSDRRFRRNRVRHEVLPLLGDIAERDVVAVMARQSQLLFDDAALLEELSASIDPTDAKALSTAPIALARRAVRRWLSGEHPPSASEVERVLAVAAGTATACELAGGVRVERHRQRLRVVPPSAV
ncbi:MAG: tRNA lysidine(34) synthetase TilS [Acidimicrobiia bacterium]